MSDIGEVLKRIVDQQAFPDYAMPKRPLGEISRVERSVSSRSHDAVIRVYDDAGNVIETHEHSGDFREP
jgi:hypothetical protein